MSKGLKISRKIWITIWIVAVVLAMVGGIAPAESWKFDIQLPGVMVALLLMSVTGPLAMMFGASGEFVAVVTILTNGLVYAALISLVLVVLKAFKRES
jgi:hypothetical protein